MTEVATRQSIDELLAIDAHAPETQRPDIERLQQSALAERLSDLIPPRIAPLRALAEEKELRQSGTSCD